jgi:hypothetical protein
MREPEVFSGDKIVKDLEGSRPVSLRKISQELGEPIHGKKNIRKGALCFPQKGAYQLVVGPA